MFAFLLIYILMFYTMPKPPYNWLPNYSLMLLCVIKSKHLYMYILHYFVSPGIMAILILNKFRCSFVHKSVDGYTFVCNILGCRGERGFKPIPEKQIVSLYISVDTVWLMWLTWLICIWTSANWNHPLQIWYFVQKVKGSWSNYVT